MYCSGIGGIGLSAYASLQRAAGHTVSGSDAVESALLADLRSQGITVTTEQDGKALDVSMDLLVYSEAVPPDHPERLRAAELHIPCQSYFQALGDLSRGQRIIAVCGTHGKSSTTAMAAEVIIAAGLDPTVVVGTKVPALHGRNWRKGKGEIFLLEACEYRRSFHYLSPRLILLTNVDGDHFDFYRDPAAYRAAFTEFFRLLPPDGVVVGHGGDADCRAAVAASGRRFMDADRFPLPSLRVPGQHMRENAQLVCGMAEVLDIPQETAQRALMAYGGVWRRMEVKGEREGILVVDDYAHHPREIRAVLAALREAYPARRIVCVFQPHTHHRTLALYADFLPAFADASLVIIPHVYAARAERDAAQVDLSALLRGIAAESGVPTVGGFTLAETAAYLRREVLRDGDLLLCMGAGDITELAGQMMTMPALLASPLPGQ